MLKQQARKAFIDLRRSLSGEDYITMNQQMLDLFRTVSLQGIQHLLSYYPIPERKEFDTIACEQLLKLDNGLLRIYWPRISLDGYEMQPVLKDENTVLVKNRFNIAEPADGEIIDPQLLDAVFVPLLAFDLQGYRVGYGKGFYDRFLARCSEDVVKIGFSYFEALERIDDIDQYDVPLNFCITPGRVYEF